MEYTTGLCIGLLLVFGFLSISGDAIRCFQCSSASDPGCADLKKNDTNSRYYKECPESHGLKPFFCRKTSMMLLKNNNNNVARISRSCGTIINRNNESNCYRADTDFKTETSCQCFKDACNSVSQTNPTMLFLMPILAAIAVYYATI